MKNYIYPIVGACVFAAAWEALAAHALHGPGAVAGAAGSAGLGAWAGWAAARLRRRRLMPDLVGDLDDSRWQEFILNAADWFWETDAEHRFTFISDRFFTTYGLDPANILGRTRRDLATPEALLLSADAWNRHQADLAAHRPFRDFEYALTDGNGRPCFARVSGVPLFRHGRFLGYRGFARDVTGLRHSDQALRAAKEEAEIANRAKTEFLANMSHELRTPLNSIIGFSDILIRETFGPIAQPQYKEYVGDINAAGKHLLQLINDLLDLARIERGQMTLNEQRLDVGLVFNACLRLVRERALEARVSLDMEVPADFPALLADELRVKQALVNLLSNAVKFTNAGGAVRVIAGRDGDGGIRLTVSDTGIGIAPEDIETALSEFGQVDGTLARKHEGTGLGLTLARKLMGLHGGELILESEVGKGTRAHLRFPPARAIRVSRAS